MDAHRNISSGNSPGISLLKGITAGALLGITAFLGKLVLSAGIEVDPAFLLALAFNPLSWMLAVTGISGFLLLQSSLHRGRVSIITSVVGGFAIIIPVILAFVFLGEFISEIKWLGIFLVLIGALGLGGR